METIKSEVFSTNFLSQIRDRFWFIDRDPLNDSRLFFENAGGSLTLKSVTETDQAIIALPDCASRRNKTALWLGDIVEKGKKDFRLLVGAKSGDIVTSLTASRVLFQITKAIIENAPGTNVVTTRLEHPSSYDSAQYYAAKTGKEFRAAAINPITGTVDVEEILSKIDRNTSLLSFICASNMTGAILDIKAIIQGARKISPDIYVLVDAVQHAPHALIDVEDWGVDGLVIAPYKMFGKRGFGLGYISDRVAALPHEEVCGKKKDRWSIGSADPSCFNSLTQLTDYISWIGKEYGAGDDRRKQIVQGMNLIHAYERNLLTRLLQGSGSIPGLQKIPGVTVHCVPKTPADRDLILAITLDGQEPTTTTQKYMGKNVIVFERLATSPFSQRIMQDLQLSGVVRVSPMHYNTLAEIDRFLEITAEVVAEK